MKKSELRQIIREELQLLNEATSTDLKIFKDPFKELIKKLKPYAKDGGNGLGIFVQSKAKDLINACEGKGNRAGIGIQQLYEFEQLIKEKEEEFNK